MPGISIPKEPLEFKMKLNENMQMHHGSPSTSWPRHPLLVDLADFQWAGGFPFDLEWEVWHVLDTCPSKTAAREAL